MAAGPIKYRNNADGLPVAPRPMIMTSADGLDLGCHAETGALLTFAAQAAGVNSADQINPGQAGIKLVVDITAVGSAPSLVVAIRFKDPTSGKYVTMLTSAAMTAVGTYVLTIYPGIASVANLSLNDVLPRTYRIDCTLSGGTVTGTIAAILLN